ncbi:hypothetical protein ABIB38_001090 [Massilia sp. UYP11]|uniref:hypothetical protein n=1 Tax=Massilia sp. UYP11 TaxID=1756385 RepID=UPI003D190994
MTDYPRTSQFAPQMPSEAPALAQRMRLIGASPAPMCIVRGDGAMAAANPAFAALLEGAAIRELAARILDGSLAQAGAGLEHPAPVKLSLSPLRESDGAMVGVPGVPGVAASPQAGSEARFRAITNAISQIGLPRPGRAGAGIKIVPARRLAMASARGSWYDCTNFRGESACTDAFRSN